MQAAFALPYRGCSNGKRHMYASMAYLMSEGLLSMRGGKARPMTNSLLLLAFTISTSLTLPAVSEGEAVAFLYQAQTTTTQTTTNNNTTSTVVTSSHTSTTVTSTTTTTTSPPVPWDLLIPMLIFAVSAVLTVVIVAVLVVTRRRRAAMPAMHMVCPRCRMPISPYDTICRNCRTPLYRAYRFYPHRR